jgi:hypothetical protein
MNVSFSNLKITCSSYQTLLFCVYTKNQYVVIVFVHQILFVIDQDPNADPTFQRGLYSYPDLTFKKL